MVHRNGDWEKGIDISKKKCCIDSKSLINDSCRREKFRQCHQYCSLVQKAFFAARCEQEFSILPPPMFIRAIHISIRRSHTRRLPSPLTTNIFPDRKKKSFPPSHQEENALTSVLLRREGRKGTGEFRVWALGCLLTLWVFFPTWPTNRPLSKLISGDVLRAPKHLLTPEYYTGKK